MTREKTGGRQAGTPNRATAHIRELASVHADEAIQVLADLAKGEKTPAAARVSAAKEIIERGYGRSGNIVSLNLATQLSQLQTKDALDAVLDSVTKGEVSVDDGVKLTNMIEAKIKAVEMAELEAKLDAIAERLP